MTPKEKAKKLVERFLSHAYPFSAGSGHLTGEIDKESMLRGAKELATMCVEEVFDCLPSFANDVRKDIQSHAFWKQVEQEIDKIEI